MKMFCVFLVMIVTIAAEETGDDQHETLSPMMGEITTQLYVTLDNYTRVSNVSSVSEMMNQTRRDVLYNPALIGYSTPMNRRIMLCYMTTVTYRNAIADMDRYFNVRDLYVGNLEYEVGYLTHEVIIHYQMILELYQIIDRRYIKHPERNFAPVNYVFFMYTNILDLSKVVIHLCNMMHELEGKYKLVKPKGVFADHDMEKPGSKNYKSNMTEHERQQLAYQKWLQQQAREQKKVMKERKKYIKKLQKFGITTSTKKKAKKKGKWPLDYGWSIENW